MSLEVLLIPAALGIAAWQVRKDSAEDAKVVQVATRHKDRTLLAEALRALGAEVEQDTEFTSAYWPDLAVSFATGEDAILHAYCKQPLDEAVLLRRISELDGTYARLVQRAVVERVRAQAGQLGLRLESETVNDDDSISLLLEVLQ